MVPVIKVSSIPGSSQRWADLIDYDAGPVALGEKGHRRHGLGTLPADPGGGRWQ